nr:MAG TPA: hypothetical protein [Caudoviricetes sp.]
MPIKMAIIVILAGRLINQVGLSFLMKILWRYAQ